MRTFFILGLVFLLLLSIVSAQDTQSLTLLTVKESENGSLVGGIASMTLTIKPGTGSIFIESFPLSEIDTQASTRIATEIACEFTTKNCDHYDFFYTIKADSARIGGPSAGGATSLLALATLEGKQLTNLAMTGGISSGGLITSVGGVAEKTLVAQTEDVSLILIPAFALNNTNNRTNETPILLENLQDEASRVQPIYTLSQAYELATGKSLKTVPQKDPPTYYYEQMRGTAQLLCERSSLLFEETALFNDSLLVNANELYNKSLQSSDAADYYSAASFCYSANLRLRELVIDELDQEVRAENYYRLIQAHSQLEEQVEEYPLKTLSDLEAYMVVKERLLEAQEYIEDINVTNITASGLSLAVERYYSAVAWSSFFGLPGDELIIDSTSMQVACVNELREAENRVNYLRTIVPEPFLEESVNQLEGAYTNSRNGNYPLCFFKASKAKAHADVFLTQVLGEEQLQQAVAIKRARARELIATQQQENLFPILGYSYYEYAGRLAQEQPYTALLFTEYALGMSDLTNYFPKAQRTIWDEDIQINLIIFIAGAMFGIGVYQLFTPSPRKKKKKRRR